MKEITIQVEWNEESAAWLASSDDVPGLIVESASYQELIEIIEDLLPDFVDSSAQIEQKAIPYQLISHHLATRPAS